MKIGRIPGLEGKTVVVLGAGATRGSQVVESSINTGELLPPLDADFFTQAQRLCEDRELVEKLMADTVGIFGSNFSLTMESFLTQVEFLESIYETHRFRGRPGANPYTAVRLNFLQVIALLLEESLGREPDCQYHRRVVELLEPDDVVLNFNYDCLFDTMLRLNAGEKWSARDGYGVRAYAEPDTNYWSNRPRALLGSQVFHLKMHGSLHWHPTPDEPVSQSSPVLHLKEKWWRDGGNVDFELIPPVWNKPVDRGVYTHIWRRARSAVRSAEILMFVGYSMPHSDLAVQALLRIDAIDQTHPAEPAKAIVIANPDRDSRRRIRDVLHSRIDASTQVLVFDTFKELHGFLGPRLIHDL